MAKEKIILIYITSKDKKEAKMIATHLLKRRLIACANIFPISSLYWWKGKIEKGMEVLLIAKTIPKNYAKVKVEVKKIHSYKTPCIIKIDAEANDGYLMWIRDEVR